MAKAMRALRETGFETARLRTGNRAIVARAMLICTSDGLGGKPSPAKAAKKPAYEQSQGIAKNRVLASGRDAAKVREFWKRMNCLLRAWLSTAPERICIPPPPPTA
jgi:hypothetical protein